MSTALRLAERGLVPEALLRKGIRALLRERLREQRRIFDSDPERAMNAWVEHMRAAPIALVPEKANEQHYEVPAAFFQLVLGPRLKYSSGYYEHPQSTLADAEEAMLALTVARAGLEDGQDVLELGCGWGSLTLWLAERHPHSRILAVSNSRAQRVHIEGGLRRLGLRNASVVTADMNELATDRRFDRVVSVEMFEHMRNWERLLARIAVWLRPQGRLFLHVFAHERFAYPFEARDESDWMSRRFFSGGMMPCHGLIDRLDTPFQSVGRWVVPGTHYARTAEDWLCNLERQREHVLAIFGSTYGAGSARSWFQRWRLFFLACAELFAFDQGREWFVSHELLRPQPELVLLRRISP